MAMSKIIKNSNLSYYVDKQINEVVKNEFKSNVTNKNVSVIDYLNYGWLDSIFEYGYIDSKNRSYKLKDLKELIDMKFSKTERQNLGSSYIPYIDNVTQ